MVTETEYQQLSAVLDDLIYGVGEDENHPLSAAMTLVGILIKAYEDEHFPKLTDLFPELAKDTSIEATGKSINAVATISGKIETDFAAAFFSIGYLFSEADKAEKAISAYDSAIRLKPDYVQAYANRGNVRFRLGEYESAINDYTEAIRLNQNFAGVYINRAKAKTRLSRIVEAKLDFQSALKLAKVNNDDNFRSNVEHMLQELNEIE